MFRQKKHPMRAVFFCLPLMMLAAVGSEPGTFVEQPNLVGKIAEALVASKDDQLTPHTTRDGDKLFSYHLKSVSYLGAIERGSEKFILATALFLRSSAQGSEYPPARGHGFLLCLSPDFRLVSHCRLDFPDVDLVGTELRRKQEKIGDFAASGIARTRGFLIDGNDVLPYPFSDKLADPNDGKRKGELEETHAQAVLSGDDDKRDAGKGYMKTSGVIVDLCVYEQEFIPAEGGKQGEAPFTEGSLITRAVVTGVHRGKVKVGTKIDIEETVINPPEYLTKFRSVVEGRLLTYFYFGEELPKAKKGRHLVGYNQMYFDRDKDKDVRAFLKSLHVDSDPNKQGKQAAAAEEPAAPNSKQDGNREPDPGSEKQQR